MKPLKISIALALSLPLFMLSCSENDNNSQKIEVSEEEKARDSIKQVSAQKVFYSIPSPLETSMFLKDLDIPYDKNMLNPATNKEKYSTVGEKALNLGVYGACLGYVSIYDKTQEAMQYLAATEYLAKEIGLSHVFTVENIEKFENSLNDKEAMIELISDTYLEIDLYLKENDREALSALTIAGGWIEGLHIAVVKEEKLRLKADHEKMINIIIDQKTALDNLVLLTEFYVENEKVATIHKQLLALKSLYDIIDVQVENNEAVSESDGITTIGGSGTIDVKQSDIEAIGAKVKEIRNSIVNI